MLTSTFDYALPEELIAQHPVEKRDASRLLVLDRSDRSIHTAEFRSLPQFLREGDCMVLNDTRVIPARLHGTKETGGNVEIFLLREVERGLWEGLVRPSAKVKPGTIVHIGEHTRAVVHDRLEFGRRLVRFEDSDVLGVLRREGKLPLPPYIQRENPDSIDLTRYQTIYARQPGAVAAPTAGLHFTDDVFRELDAKRVTRATLTLHVGYGTFSPVRTETIEAHPLEAEDFVLSDEAALQINGAKAGGGRIVAVGTTSTRVLETQVHAGRTRAGAGQTRCFIFPPYEFQSVDVLLTNFHLPRSSLLALVCAFGGTEFVLEGYRRAVSERYRFYSYGDAMLIL
jgi:S-adenosylmethionine:tRNA ribosyltransferase-isomerase